MWFCGFEVAGLGGGWGLFAGEVRWGREWMGRGGIGGVEFIGEDVQLLFCGKRGKLFDEVVVVMLLE